MRSQDGLLGRETIEATKFVEIESAECMESTESLKFAKGTKTIGKGESTWEWDEEWSTKKIGSSKGTGGE